MRISLAVIVLAALSLPAAEIVAHRGASFVAPENSVAAIRQAWEQNADASEFDVWLSKDGRIVVTHDENLKRVAGLDRTIGSMTAAELAAVDVGAWKEKKYRGEKMPTLAAMLATVPKGKRVFIEVKCGPEIVPELERVLKASKLLPAQTAVIAFDAEVIAAVKAARPDLQAYWLVSLGAKKDKPSPKVEALLATTRRIKADGLNLSATPSVLAAEYAKAIRDAGFKLMVWTVNDVDLARRMIALGVDAVTTDRPQFMRDRLMRDPATVHVMSFNIRYGTANDGDNAWPKRKDLLFQTIHAFDPDLLGTQETLAFQRDELAKKLPGHRVIGVGRDDGKEKGEMMAIFYRASRFEQLDGGHFWLSETPDVVGSKSWDSSLPRIATWLKLKDENAPDAKPILYVNTHFDHRGPEARLAAAKLIRAKLIELGRGCRLILTGDFNCGEGSKPYTALFGEASPIVDSLRAFQPTRGKLEGTATGFRAGPLAGARIDWIGASPDWAVLDARIDHTTRDGRTPSDHFAVQAVLAPRWKTLRVLTYNIHHGEGTDRKLDLTRIAKVIAEAKPDVVALQEVDRNTRRTSHVDQTAELARLTGMYGAFGKAIDYDGGEYGQALLSRLPMESLRVHPLPGMPDREQRIAFEAIIRVNGHPAKIVTTHLHHNNADYRKEQAAKLNELYAESVLPTLLIGDLNAMPDSEPIALLAKQWQIPKQESLPTFPAREPRKQIDYLLLQSPQWTVQEQRVVPEVVASDHRPLLTVLKLDPTK